MPFYNLHLLKIRGCMRVRVTDRKQLPTERSKAEIAAACIGHRAYTSYRYPFLYVRLGERLAPHEMPAGESGPTHAGHISAERRWT